MRGTFFLFLQWSGFLFFWFGRNLCFWRCRWIGRRSLRFWRAPFCLGFGSFSWRSLLFFLRGRCGRSFYFGLRHMSCKGWKYDVHPPTSPGSSTKRSCPTATVSSSFASNFTIVPDVGAFTETSIWPSNQVVRYRNRPLIWLGSNLICLNCRNFFVCRNDIPNLFWPGFECPFSDGLCHLWHFDSFGLNKVLWLEVCLKNPWKNKAYPLKGERSEIALPYRDSCTEDLT